MSENGPFELFNKYFDSFAVNFACNFTYIFGSVVYKLISLTARLGCLWDNKTNCKIKISAISSITVNC